MEIKFKEGQIVKLKINNKKGIIVEIKRRNFYRFKEIYVVGFEDLRNRLFYDYELLNAEKGNKTK